MPIGGHEKDRIFVDCDSTMADVQPWVLLIGVMPDEVTGARIHGPNIVRDSDIRDTIYQKRSNAERYILIGLKYPAEAERSNILWRDLCEFTVTAAGIVAVVCGPGICRRIQNGCGI